MTCVHTEVFSPSQIPGCTSADYDVLDSNGHPKCWLGGWVQTVDGDPDPGGINTEGNVTDYAEIRKFITGVVIKDNTVQTIPGSIAERYNLKGLAYDRFNSSQLVIDLIGDGITATPHGRGFVSMSQPTKEIERMCLDGELWHTGDKLLAWEVANVFIQMDPAGNVKPNKEKAADKIDGVVAMAMSVGEMLHHLANPEEDDSIPTDWVPRWV